MSDSAETTFKINDLLISVVATTDPDQVPTQIFGGTVLVQRPPTSAVPTTDPDEVPTALFGGTIVTNVITHWPTGAIMCGADGLGPSLVPGAHDPPLLAGVKALLRAQIAELEGQQGGGSSTSLMPTTVQQAVALEAKLSAALDTVRNVKANLEAAGGA